MPSITVLDTPIIVETPNNVEVFPEQRVETPIIIDFPADKQSEKGNIIFNSDARNVCDNLPSKGVWLKGDPLPKERTEFKNKLDELFGTEGKWIKDGPYTKGRNAVEWTFDDGTKVVWEKHPYDRKKGYPKVHTERHYHIILPDGTHLPGFFGTY
ncbi:hypothetical protein [Clostridium sp. ZBS13]|uniref:hypothetical protein n=1 Tax=Clostridium sp. ZBS13 TaxID=2949971 RepID=UPI00207984BF|nr:hypothetical protein [Clostridium sp. ZBS13]